MTQFPDDITEEDAKKLSEKPAKGATGKAFFTQCEQHLTEALKECVARHDGESVEDYTMSIVLPAVLSVEKQDLVKSFLNGKKASYRAARKAT